jgi:hypothetical protein
MLQLHACVCHHPKNLLQSLVLVPHGNVDAMQSGCCDHQTFNVWVCLQQMQEPKTNSSHNKKNAPIICGRRCQLPSSGTHSYQPSTRGFACNRENMLSSTDCPLTQPLLRCNCSQTAAGAVSNVSHAASAPTTVAAATGGAGTGVAAGSTAAVSGTACLSRGVMLAAAVVSGVQLSVCCCCCCCSCCCCCCCVR